MSDILRAKGQNGQVEFDGRNVTIKRGGFYGTMTVGRGDKVIPVQSIAGVRYRKASLGGTVRGIIEFTVPGGMEQRTRAGTRQWTRYATTTPWSSCDRSTTQSSRPSVTPFSRR